ncbi:MAG: CBS domain-containing protein [Nitrospiraceae bacterium]|nr:MAG: CBS domain-containing protein [Nitrospiraceae bacterium]
MNIRQIMKKDPITVLPTSSIREAVRKMKEYNVGSILAVEEGWRLRGILTDRDVAFSLVTDGKNLDTSCVCDVMVSDPISVNADADLDSALRIMSKANIRRLPVTENGKLVGIVALPEIAIALKEEFNQFISLEESYARH